MNYIDILFNKNIPLNKNNFINLYYSYDDISFVGYDEEILLKNKKYDSIKPEIEVETAIGEKHKEYKAILNLDELVFLRVIINQADQIYDVLIYSIKDEQTYMKYKNIFFKDILILPEELNNEKNMIIKFIDEHVKIIKNSSAFIHHLGYEDWDYRNKLLDNLDMSVNDANFINDINQNTTFTKTYEFRKNGLDIIKLTCEFTWHNGYYIIKKI